MKIEIKEEYLIHLIRRSFLDYVEKEDNSWRCIHNCELLIEQFKKLLKSDE
jgi:hypothetical protein